jgi:predicted nucleic acid-binding protein
VFVLLDSNVWLAALARDGICRRVVESSAVSCTPVVTPFICAEVRDKLLTKFQRTEEQANELVSNSFPFLCSEMMSASFIAVARSG